MRSSMMSTRQVIGVAVVAAVCCATIGANGQEGGRALEEKTIYVPYEKLAEVFEKEGRGIFLPYREFLELWQRAQPKPPPPPDRPPPAAAVISGGRYTGEVREGLATFEVEYRVNALEKKGWSTLALPLANAAVEEVEIEPLASDEGDGDGATSAPPLIQATDGGYAIHMPRAGAYRVRLKLSTRVEERPGRRSFSFGIPPAAMSRLELVIHEENAQLEVEPSVAATRVEEREGATRVLAFVGNSDRVTVSWSPPARRDDEKSALLTARQAIRAHVGERVLRVSTDIALEVLRQEIDRVRVHVPREMEVFPVAGENIREWNVIDVEEGGRTGRVLEIRLHSPVRDSFRFSLAFERILTETPSNLEIPFPRIDGALRESGVVALSHDAGLKVRVAESEGLSQRNLEELPEALRAGTFAGFRYLAHPLRLGVEIERILPVIHTESTSVVILGVEEDVWIGWIDYRISRAGVFSVSFRVPSRWRVAELLDEGTVEDYQSVPLENEPEFQVITVNLRNRAFGRFQLPFRLTAIGSASAGEKTLHAPRPLGVESDRGLLGVGGPRAFRISTIERTGTIAADTQELFRSGVRSRIPQDAAVDLAFTFHDHPASVRVQLDERKTEIKANTRLLVNVTDSEMQVSQDIEYLVQYAAIDTISFSAPSSLDDRLQLEVAGFRDQRKTPVGDGRTRWDITLQSRVLGVRTVRVSYDESLDLRTGEPRTVPIALIRAEGAAVEQGTVAIRKEGRLEVVETVDGLQRIDRQELPPELSRGNIQGAYQITRPIWSLALELTRHDYVKVPDGVVKLLLERGHLSRERILDADVVIVLENSGLQYLDLRLPENSQNVRFFVGGKERVPQRRPRDGEAGAAGATGDTSAAARDRELRLPLGERGVVVVQVRYQVALGGSLGTVGGFDIVTPAVLELEGRRVPVEKIELELRVPADLVYLPGGGTLYTTDVDSIDPWTWLSLSVFSNAAVARAHTGPRTHYGPLKLPELSPELARGDMKLFRLQTFRPEGETRFAYIGRRAYTVLNLGVFAVAIAAGALSVRRWRGRRWSILIGSAAVLLLLAWLSAAPVAVLFLSAYRGVLLVFVGLAVIVCVPRVRGRIQRWRAERFELAPDPFLEEAEPVVIVSDEPSAEKPADEKGAGEGEGDGEKPAGDDSEKKEER